MDSAFGALLRAFLKDGVSVRSGFRLVEMAIDGNSCNRSKRDGGFGCTEGYVVALKEVSDGVHHD